jgi:hypothetical protein
MVWNRFRWVYCQLDALSRCFPQSIRRVIDELPVTLDDTYEQTLQGIPKEKQEHAHRLLQCLVVGIRPLRVEELAEIFAIKFEKGAGLNVVEDWRPENSEEEVLSACSTLITVIDDEDRKIVQFSHVSVKEFLTSDRLGASKVASIRRYHVSLDAAHALLARACLAVLLQLDDKPDKKWPSKLPLASYAAQYWVRHAQFEGVASRVKNAMERFFDPKKPHLRAWTKIHDVQREKRGTIKELVEWYPPTAPRATPLYYAVFCGFTELAHHLIVAHREDVNAECGRYGSPLNAASHEGHLDATRLLLDHGADVNARRGVVPLWRAYGGRQLEVMRLLLARGADADARGDHAFGTMLHHASHEGKAEVARLLLQHGADVNAAGDQGFTPLHFACMLGRTKVVRLLLDHGADMDAKSRFDISAFELAQSEVHEDVLRLMLEHRQVGGTPSAHIVAYDGDG